MTWQLWVAVGMLAMNPVLAIARIGVPRKPVEPGEALANLMIAAILITLIVTGAR